MYIMSHFKEGNIPSGNQTWLAGKYTTYYGGFPIETPFKVNFQLPRLMKPKGTMGNLLYSHGISAFGFPFHN